MAFGDAIVEAVLGKVSVPEDTDNTPNAIAEGAAVNTTVGITAHSTFANGNASLDYSLSADSSGGGFKIDPNTGVVTVADPSKIDFESAPGHAYTITVLATKNNNFSNSQTFTISVNDVAPSAPVDSNAAANTVLEGAANGTAVGITASSSDVNGGAVTYSLIGDTSGGGFTINATTGVVTVADGSKIDFESSAGHAYTVTVQSSDGTLTSSQAFTINVGDVALTTPVDTNGAANSVAEGAAAGTTVGITASATDPSGPATTYSLIGDTSGGGFTINASTGVVTVANPAKIDFESTAPGHTYNITVQASNGVTTTSQAFTVGVTDVAPSAPTDSNAAANTVAEGAANGTVVGVTASSTDVNGGAVTYSLIGDTSGGGFTINATTGVVTVADSTKLNFETAPGHAYSITTQASDGTLANSQTFTIAVTDVAPSAPVDSNGAANTVAEGAANGSTVGVTAFSTDVNGPGVTYSLVGDTSNGGFTINSTTGVVTVADSTKLDFETTGPGHTYTVTAQASDGTLTNSQAFTIAVTDVAPSAPTDINGAANTVAEGAANGSTVGITASSVDPNGPATTYSLTDNAGGRFAIDPSTGIVTVANGAAVDFETAPGHAYGITVLATSGALSTSTAFSIGVTDVGPSTPTDSNGAADSVFEGAANGTVVGITASSTDPGGGPAPTYTLTDSAGGRFAIDPTTGIVTVANGAAIDFETAPGHAYSITVQSTAGALSTTQAFTIAVGDVAPSAPVDSNGAADTVAEGAANGSAVGVTAFSTDVNGPGVTYSLTGDTSGGGFAINSTTGVITVADGTKLDFETTGPGHTYTVTAQASDGTLTNSHAFTIAVTDVAPSAPTDINGATNTIAEGAANGSTVGITASSVDPNGPATTYSLTDSAGGRFAIDPSTGIVTVANGAAVDFETAPGHAYGITVLATSGALSTSTAFSIGVTDVGPSTPTDSNGAADSVFEGAANGTVVGITASSTDPGGGPAPTYTLTDSAGGRFAIDPTTGIVTVANGAAVDFETAPGPGHSYGITVQSTAGALSTTQNFSIAVGDVNEAPQGTDKTVTMLEGDSYTFSVADFGFSDPSDSVNPNSLQAVKMTTVPGAGTGTFTNNGATVNANDFVSATDIALGHLVFTPAAHSNGAPEATFTFQVQDNGGTLNGGVDLDQSANTVSINVNAVNDAPVNSVPLATQSVNEEATLTFSSGGGNAITISDIDVGSGNETVTLTVSNGTLALGSHAGLVSFSPDNAASITLTGTVANINNALDGLTYTGSLDFHGNDTLVVGTNDNGNTGAGGPKTDSDNVSITVNDVADTPSVTNATTNEDTQSASGLVVSRNATDGPDVAFFKITGIANGTLFQNDGTTAINNGDFITFAQANAGLKFTPAANFFGDGSFNVQASTTNSNAGLGGSLATATITVDPVADTPSVTNATTNEDTQSAAGLVVSHNAADGAEVGFVKVTNITHGTLFQNDGTTAINNGDFITYAQANAGLKFTPAADFFGNGSFDVQASTSNTDAGLGGSAVTATIAVNAVADTPSVTNATTNEDTQSTSGLVVTHNPVDGAEVGFVKITGITNGTLFQNDGTTAINNGDFITYAQANAGLKFTPAADFNGDGSFNVQASTSNSNAGLGGSVQTATITVAPVNDAPTLTAHDRDPAYVAGVQLFDTTHVSVGPADESAQNIKQLVLTVSNVDGTGTTDHLSIDGTDVFLTNGNTAVGANHGVSISVGLAGGTATVTIAKPVGDIPAADVESIVNGLTYTNDDVTAGETARHVTLTSIQDDGGGTAPNVDTTALSIDSTVNFNVAPTITAGDTLTYIENATSVIDSTITITDPDNANMASAKVTITTGFNTAQDVLNFTPVGAITGSYDTSTGVLTLSGSDTKANYELALESVTYHNTSDDPTTAQRTVTYTVNDGNVDSAPGTATINVTAVNDEPTLTATASNPGFTENGSPVGLFSGAAASAVEAAQNLDQLVLTVTNVAGTGATEDLTIDGTVIALTNGNTQTTATNGMSVVVGLAAGTATVTISKVGGISSTAMNTLVNDLAYSNTSDDPGNASRVVTLTSLRDTGANGGPNNDDNIHSGLTVQSTVSVTPVNDEPTLTATANGGGAVTFIEDSSPGVVGSGPVDLFSTPHTSTVESGQTITQVVLTVTNVVDTTEYLNIGGTPVELTNHSEAITAGGAAGTATVSVTAGTATITVTPTTTFSAANIDSLVDSLAYNNDDNTPTATTHTISVTSLTDSGSNIAPNDNTGSPSVSTIVTVQPTNDAPVAQDFNFTGNAANDAIGNTSLVLDDTTVAGAPDPAGPQKTINGSLLTGATDVDGPGPLVTVAQNNVATAHGHVTVNTSGEFSYTPNAGYIGTDTFNYQVSDQNPGTPGLDTGTVTVNVATPKVWYVNADAGTDGDGTSANPFNNLSHFAGAGGVDGAGDTIFLYNTTTNHYTGGLTLENNEKLIGQSQGLTVNGTTLETAAGSNSSTVIDGGVVLGSGDTISGVTLGNTTAGTALSGTNFGTFNVDHTAVNTNNNGMILTNGAFGAGATFTSFTSAGATDVSLTNVTGSVDLGTGTMSGQFAVSGGSVNTTYSGNLSQANNAAMVNVSGGHTGTMTFQTGTLTATNGTGLQFDNADGTYNFNGTNTLSNAVGGANANAGINIANGSGGAFSFSSNSSIVNQNTGTAFNVDGGGGNVTYAGTIGTTTVGTDNHGNTSVSITNKTGGTVAFSGNILDSSDTGGGIGVSNNANTTVNFSSTTKTLNTGIGDAVSMSSNSGTSNVNFTGGGLDIDTTNGTGFSATGAGTYSVTGTGNTINTTGTGAALNLSSVTVGGTGVTFDTTTSTGGTNNVNLSTVTGTGDINLGSGALSGASGVAFNVSGGTGNIDYNGSIAKTSDGRVIDVQNHTTGNLSFDGTVSSTSASDGIHLSGNTSATIGFTNALTLNTSASNTNAFDASGGGTVTATNTTSTLSSGAGTALSVSGTNIGSGGLHFLSINANGGTNGIVLNNTGTAAGNGGLTVTGDGSTAGSGGTIQETTQGAVFTSTKGVSLSYMNFTNADHGEGTVTNVDSSSFNSAAQAAINMSSVTGATLDHLNINGNGGAGGVQAGINGQNVSNLTLSNSTVSGFGDESNEGNVLLWNLTGTSSITNSTFGFAAGDTSAGSNLVDIRNGNGTTLTLNVNGNTFQNTQTSANGAAGLSLTTVSNAVLNGDIVNNDFLNLKTVGIQTFARDTSNQHIDITDAGSPGSPVAGTGNTFDPGAGNLGRAIDLSAEDSANLFFNINRNGLIKGSGGPVINVFGINTAHLEGRIDANTNIQGGGVGSVGSPIFIHPEDASTGVVEIVGNTISASGQDPAIFVTPHGDGAGPSTDNGTLDITIASNTITMAGTGSPGNGAVGIDVRAGSNNGDTTITYAKITNNHVTLAQPADDIAFLAREGANSSHLYFDGSVSGANNQAIATNYWNANGNTPTNSVFSLDAGGAQAYASIPAGHNGGHVVAPANPTALFSASGGVASASNSPGETNLSQAALDNAVAAAITLWTAAGLSTEQVAALQHVTYDVADITPGWLGQSTPGHVTIDVNADGNGWFIDSTPGDNSEFANAASATDLTTDPSTAAAGHMDLLTTVMHEMGEQLGLADQFAATDQGHLMYAYLAAGERVLPDATDVAEANASGAMQAEAALPVSAQAAIGTAIVVATIGNDTINAGHGGSILFGGAGADNFVFGPSIPLNAPTPAQITHVADYHAAEGDTFDFSALTSAFHNSSVNDSLVVRAVEDASGKFAMLQVDHIDPMGLPSAPNWVNVVQLDGAHAGDAVNVLIDNHSVHLAQIHVDLLV